MGLLQGAMPYNTAATVLAQEGPSCHGMSGRGPSFAPPTAPTVVAENLYSPSELGSSGTCAYSLYLELLHLLQSIVVHQQQQGGSAYFLLSHSHMDHRHTLQAALGPICEVMTDVSPCCCFCPCEQFESIDLVPQATTGILWVVDWPWQHTISESDPNHQFDIVSVMLSMMLLSTYLLGHVTNMLSITMLSTQDMCLLTNII